MRLKNYQEKESKLKAFHETKSENILDYMYLPTSAEYIVTNDLSQSSTDDVEFEQQTRWKIEEFYTRIKYLKEI